MNLWLGCELLSEMYFGILVIYGYGIGCWFDLADFAFVWTSVRTKSLKNMIGMRQLRLV